MVKKTDDFFKHIASIIEHLSDAYSIFNNEIDLIDTKAVAMRTISVTKEDQYAFHVQRLNRAISAFKSEMQDCLAEYYFQAENDMISSYAINHIEAKLKILKTVYKKIGKKVPDSILKQELKGNYFFHTRISKLTPKKIMEYFELNYLLSKKK